MDSKRDINRIRDDIESIVGEKVRLKANKGRKKTFEEDGIVEKTYPNIFIIKINKNNSYTQRISYSYSDILTNTVELAVFGSDGLEKLKFAV